MKVLIYLAYIDWDFKITALREQFGRRKSILFRIKHLLLEWGGRNVYLFTVKIINLELLVHWQFAILCNS